MNREQGVNDLVEILKFEASAAGRDLTTALDDIRLYTVQRAAHLSTLVGQPGFQDAVRMERDNVALHAGIIASQQADVTDHRILGIIQAGLAILARVPVA